MQKFKEAENLKIDESFKDKVIIPGFIDPHLHPSLGATILPCHFITAFEWDLGTRQIPAKRGRDAYLSALQYAFKNRDMTQPLFVSYGYLRTWTCARCGAVWRPRVGGGVEPTKEMALTSSFSSRASTATLSP